MLSRIFLGATLPALVSALVLLVAWRRRGTLGKFVASVAGALAIAGGYTLGHVMIAGWPPFPPTSALEWMVGFAVLAAIGGILFTLARVSSVLLVAAVPWLLLAPLAQYTWNREETALHLAGLSFSLLGVWVAVQTLSRHVSARVLSIGMLVTTIAASIALAVSGGFVLGQLQGAIASTLGAALVIALVNPSTSLSGGAIAVAIVVTSALLMSGHFYGDLPTPSAGLIALSFVTPWLARWPGQVTARTRALAHVAAAVVPAAVAVGLAVAASPEWGSGY
jgi:hypothetical protein